MRIIHASDITAKVAELCIKANYHLPYDIQSAIEQASESEESPTGKRVLLELIENAKIASKEIFPICQDTGLTVVFVEIGQGVCIEGNLSEAIQEGVRIGYERGYLRKSIVAHPLERINTKDNTPAVIHYEVTSNENLRIIVAPKGAGSENMSAVKMLKPADGENGVKQFVLETFINAGANPCPPIIVGVGLGGTMEKAAILAKKALLRKIGENSLDPRDANLEKELFKIINGTGIGPSGLGGRVTALAVNVLSYPCHIASLPVAVNLQCHAARHAEVVL